MAFGAGLLQNARVALTGAKAAYSNAMNGPKFNKAAYDEARKEPAVVVEADCFEEDWNVVDKPKKTRLSSSASSSEEDQDEELEPEPEPYMVHDTSTQSQICLKLTRAAATKASKVADVSLLYVKWALRLAALEAAHEIAFLSHCRTVTDAVNAAKARFPLVEDLQRAFNEGVADAGGSVQPGMREWQPPVDGVSYPFDVKVPSNLDDIAIVSTETGEREPTYDPETKAELEIVPVLGGPRGRSADLHQSDELTVQKLPQTQSRDYMSAKERRFIGEFDDMDSQELGDPDVKPIAWARQGVFENTLPRTIRTASNSTRPRTSHVSSHSTGPFTSQMNSNSWGSGPRRSTFIRDGPYDSNDSQLDEPIIGSPNDSDEIKAREGRIPRTAATPKSINSSKEVKSKEGGRAAKTADLVEIMERRGRTAAVIERLRSED